MNRRLEILAPATSANLGPGYDCLGMALSIANRFVFQLTGSGGWQVEIHGAGGEGIPRDASNAVLQAFQAACETLGRTPPEHISLALHIRLPLARGLGSSASARAAGIAAAWELLGPGLPRNAEARLKALGALATKLEGHPDNIAPCLVGGLILSVPGADGWRFEPIPLPRPPALAICIPQDLEIETKAARAALPQQISHRDAAVSTARCALLVTALSSGRLGLLVDALDDRLHQPYRGHLIPGWEKIPSLCRKAGALGAVISGSGSSILVLAENDESAKAAAQELVELWEQRGLVASWRGLRVDPHGLRIRRIG